MEVRPVCQEDLNWLADQRNRPELRRWFRQPSLLSEQDQGTWYQSIRAFGPTFILHEGLKRLGYISLNHIQWTHRTAEFSIFVIPEVQGKGYGGTGLAWLLDHAFNDLNLHLVYGEVFSGNPGMTLYKKLGFVQEGTLRDRYFKDGAYQPCDMISITEKEWRARKPSMILKESEIPA